MANKCPKCKTPHQNDSCYLNCDKCNKKYHWQCTELEDYVIKQHKYNKYKPWRCPTCVDKFCINCEKLFPQNYQESVCCDRCNYWYHFHCSELSVDDFFHLTLNTSDKWICPKCTHKICAKCQLNTHVKSRLKCSICPSTFHKSCTKFDSKNDSKTWICPQCYGATFPFSGTDNKTLFELSSSFLDNKFSLKNSQTNTYSQKCNVCKINLKKNNLGIPCHSCKSNIHTKCSKLKNVNKTFHEQKGNWKCSTCIDKYTHTLASDIPFTLLDQDTLYEMRFNSNLTNNHRFTPDITVQDKLKLMLSYSKNSPWYAYTHPNDSDRDLFTAEPDETYVLRPNFDYYDIDSFKKQKSLWKNKSLGIFHTNICSLQANIDKMEDLLHDMDYPFDIIALTETWNPEKTKNDFLPKRLEGYLDYYGTTGHSRKGGCGFYIKNSFTPIPRKDLEFQIKDPGCETESCWIELVNEKGPNVVVGVIYRHPSKINDIFLTNLKKTLKKVNKEKKKTVISGDFNLNLLNYENDKEVSSFLSTMLQHDLQPCITEPSRITNTNKPSLVDNIFINSFDEPICGNILEHISYDHLPNFVIMNHEHANKKHTRQRRHKKDFDPVMFQAELLDNGSFLTELINKPSSESAMNLYMEKYISLLDKHCPMKNLTKKEQKTSQKPWLTQGLLKSISRKRTLFKKFKNDKWKNKESEVFKEYKTCNDIINKLKKLSKRNYYNKYFSEHMNNSKKTWIGINSLLNKHKKQQGTIFLEDKGFISDPHTVANKFNDFFLNVAGKLCEKIEKKNSKYQDYLKNPNESSFFLKETEPGDFVKIINKLDGKKSSDFYNISPENVKSTGQAVAQCLSIIFNKCIVDGHFPDSLKLAKVIPLHKGDSVLSVSNYRPISLLPIFSKLFERMIYNQFIVYIEENHILDELQFGFQRNKSTEHAISSIITDISRAFSKKQSSYCIFLDFAKAFDTVNHDILIDKLSYYGVKNQSLALFRSYLSDRSQVVEVNGVLSDKGTIKHGVPQGSILGPLLFLLYINDISKSSKILKFFLFADDTTVFYSANPNDKNTENILNKELEKVSCWLAANKLSLNVKKSNFLHFHKGNSCKIPLNLILNGTPVEEKETAKYLGTFIDNKLSWKAQIQHIKTKLARNIGLISKIRHYAKDACLKLYHSLIQSHINYNILNWTCTHNSTIDPINKKVKKAIRVVSFAQTKYEHTPPLFKSLKILPFPEHLQHRRACFMWKVKNEYILPPINNIFTINDHNQKFILPHVQYDHQKNTFEYSCIKAWKMVPEGIQNISTLDSFKLKYKEHLLNHL